MLVAASLALRCHPAVVAVDRCSMHFHPVLRVTTIMCSAISANFDATLHGLLRDARSEGPQAAVSRWLHAMDEEFIPCLDACLDAAADRGEERSCAELMAVLEEAIEQAAELSVLDECIATHWRQASRGTPHVCSTCIACAQHVHLQGIRTACACACACACVCARHACMRHPAARRRH